jgi:hypothetical protein
MVNRERLGQPNSATAGLALPLFVSDRSLQNWSQIMSCDYQTLSHLNQGSQHEMVSGDAGFSR